MADRDPDRSSTGSGETTCAGFAALVGRPNVGKSTLLNALLGQKVAIVSHRPQTTRNRILGVRTEAQRQVVLVDTPGIHHRRDNLNRFLVREAFEALEGQDAIVLVTEVDPKRLQPPRGNELPRVEISRQDEYVLEQVRERSGKTPILLVINKIDLLADRSLLLPLIERWAARGFEHIVPISAQGDDGVEAVFEQMAQLMPEGPLLYPADTLTDRAERFLVGELIREQVFTQCREEIPYATAVEVERFEERRERGDVQIDAVIFVERDSQKGIVVGAGGSRIKTIGSNARVEISKLLGCPAHVRLTVRVSPDWTRRLAERRRFGYE
jgi:GTP-binding protein Era